LIRSMTGFGRAGFAVGELRFDVEVRTVNHRHLDARVRLPRFMADREAQCKARVREHLARGKVDLSVSPASGSASGVRLEIDAQVAEQYLAAARRLTDRHHLSGALEVAALLSLPGVVQFAEPGLPEEDLSRELAGGVDAALAAADAMRVVEGEALDREFRTRLERVLALVDSLEARKDAVQQAVRDRLRKRSEQLRQETGLLDEMRLHQEIVIAADRLDVSEELARLRSHVDQFRAVLDAAGPGQPVGRRLDFLLQEMGREANTVGSKGSDAAVAHDVVDLKTELERIREQVQNVE
jgi:uncharacterized protein (TIGR00255 family)